VQQQQHEYQLDFSAIREKFSNVIDSDGLPPSVEQSQSPLWYILTTAVLLSYHKEKFIGELWAYVTSELGDDDDEERLSVARRIREACLKSSTLVGFPRVSQLTRLKAMIGFTLKELLLALSNQAIQVLTKCPIPTGH